MESVEGQIDRIGTLKAKIDALYSAKHSNRAEWADWLHAHHVFLVADKSGEIAERFGAQKELAVAAGMLHDVADAVMSRFDPKHEEESLTIAKRYLTESGFSDAEVATIEDAIRFHGCHDGTSPHSLEGKAMSAADAVVHLQSDFYDHAIEATSAMNTPEAIREWGLKKIDRDFNAKISFPELKEEVRADYERLKAKFEVL